MVRCSVFFWLYVVITVQYLDEMTGNAIERATFDVT